MQNLRLQQHVEYEVDVPEILLTYGIPNFCLLTMVENTFEHGFNGRPYPYRLAIRAEETSNNLIIQVIDNGAGIPPERLQEVGKSIVTSESNGIALYNLSYMLKLAYGSQANLCFDSQADKETVVTLILPKGLST